MILWTMTVVSALLLVLAAVLDFVCARVGNRSVAAGRRITSVGCAILGARLLLLLADNDLSRLSAFGLFGISLIALGRVAACIHVLVELQTTPRRRRSTDKQDADATVPRGLPS